MNNRHLLIILFLFLCSCNTWGQRKKKARDTKKTVPEVNIDSLLINYDFARAEALLTESIEEKQSAKPKKSTLKEEGQLEYARKGQQMLSAVEKVVVFDSVVIHRNRILEALALSQESGKVLPNANSESTQFKSEMGDIVISAQKNKNGIFQLYASDVLGEEVTEAKPLSGLDEEPDVQYNYPYMMSDGVTLYFAKQGNDSFGGYDIFMTRYDADDRKFLIPENIGMPFNSPANDYLLCIDELYNIGSFVSDRFTHPDSVCVYYFIPNNVRRVYIEEEVGSKALRQLGRLSSIRLTWDEEAKIKGAMLRLQQCQQEKQNEDNNSFHFVVADNRVYYSLNKFALPTARQAAEQWQNMQNNKKQMLQQLNETRCAYATAGMQEKKAIGAKILSLEQQLEVLYQQIEQQERKVRQLELGL